LYSYRRKSDLVIEDSAQCMSKQIYHTDYRVHSFTEGKHITAGEGGMITTNDTGWYERALFIMNHEESIVHDMGNYNSRTCGIGYNLRMTEMQAALVRSQLRRLDGNIRVRQENCQYLNEQFAKMPGIRPAKVGDGCSHSYYVLPLHFNHPRIHRDRFVAAVRAELPGLRVRGGYIEPLYRFPCFNERTRSQRLPVVERMWKDELILINDIAYPHTVTDMKDIVTAFKKVFDHEEELEEQNEIP